MVTHGLVIGLLIIKIIEVALDASPRARAVLRFAIQPQKRTLMYCILIIWPLLTVAFVPAVGLASQQLSAADLGWTWPHGRGLDYLATSAIMLAMVAAGLRAHRRIRNGRKTTGRTRTAAIVPRTPTERRLCLAMALTVAVAEEAVYRGLLIGIGSHQYHLPLVFVALTSLAFFAAAHVYQGTRALPGIVSFGALLTALYLVSGSLILPILLHLCQLLLALHLIPANPSGTESETPTIKTTNTNPPIGNDEINSPTTTTDPTQPPLTPVLRPAMPD